MGQHAARYSLLLVLREKIRIERAPRTSAPSAIARDQFGSARDLQMHQDGRRLDPRAHPAFARAGKVERPLIEIDVARVDFNEHIRRAAMHTAIQVREMKKHAEDVLGPVPGIYGEPRQLTNTRSELTVGVDFCPI
jgi:hypothetical protein